MDIEGTIQFILEQQAQFTSDIQIMKEVHKAQQDVLKAQQEQYGRDMSQVNTVLLDLATSQARTNEIVAALAQRVVDLSNLMERHITSHN